jgi:hypothetical protein
VNLLLEPLVTLGVNECIATSNARLFDFIRNRLDGILPLFVHLDGALPDQFVREMEGVRVEYHDAAREINICRAADDIVDSAACAMLGTHSSTSPGRSCPSPDATGQQSVTRFKW